MLTSRTRSSLPCPQTAFIKQEALEKAREIKVKADEEFAIEKVRTVSLVAPSPSSSGPPPLASRVAGCPVRAVEERRQLTLLLVACRQGKIVRQESANIDANFERKKKQAEIEKKMYVGASSSPSPARFMSQTRRLCGVHALLAAADTSPPPFAAPSRTRTTRRGCSCSRSARSSSSRCSRTPGPRSPT